jgi:enterochelin esterase-like enzyme
MELLKEHGVNHVFVRTPGAHVCMAWRHLLADFMQRVFQQRP